MDDEAPLVGGYILTFVAAEFAKAPGDDDTERCKGAAVSFGAAAGISALLCPIVVLLQMYGERIRRKGWIWTSSTNCFLM